MNTNKSIIKLATEVNPCYYKGELTLCSEDWYWNNIVLSYDKFYFIVEGECVIKIDGVEYNAKPGQLFLLPYNSTQTLYTTQHKTVKKYWFHCLLPCGSKDLTELIQLPHFIDVKDIPYVENLFKEILCKEKESNLIAKLDQKSYILRLLTYYIHFSKNLKLNICHNDKLTFILSYIEEHLSSDITLQELSNLLHYHPNYFVRFFKEEMGLPPMTYIHNQRIILARRLLLEGNNSIQDISAKVGFKNPHYFSRYFKKATGVSPTVYQRLAIEKHTVQGIAYVKPPYRSKDLE